MSLDAVIDSPLCWRAVGLLSILTLSTMAFRFMCKHSAVDLVDKQLENQRKRLEDKKRP